MGALASASHSAILVPATRVCAGQHCCGALLVLVLVLVAALLWHAPPAFALLPIPCFLTAPPLCGPCCVPASQRHTVVFLVLVALLLWHAGIFLWAWCEDEDRCAAESYVKVGAPLLSPSLVDRLERLGHKHSSSLLGCSSS